MAKKKSLETETVFSKDQILGSALFANRRDALGILLDDGGEYTVRQVERIIEDWLKKEVQ